MFEKRTLKIIVRQNRVKVTGSWRKLDKEELHNLSRSESLIGIICCRRMKCRIV
jgi:hypothetical protein